VGYSITAPMASEIAKKRMLAFLEKNLRKFPELLGKPADQPVYYRGPLEDGLPTNESLSYDDGPCRIGFDYNCSSLEREYIWTICRWMALQCGRIDIFQYSPHFPNLQGAFPVVVYDGQEYGDPKDGEGPQPVILDTSPGNRIPKELHWLMVNPLGLPSRPSEHRKKIIEFDNQIYGLDGQALLQKEMERLQKLWDAENPRIPCDWEKLDPGQCQNPAVRFFRDEFEFSGRIARLNVARCGYHARDSGHDIQEISLEEYLVAQVMDS